MSMVPYSSVIESLMDSMVCARPHLALAVIVVSRFMGDLKKAHQICFRRKRFSIQKIDTKENLTDMLTKSFPSKKFKNCSWGSLMVEDNSSQGGDY